MSGQVYYVKPNLVGGLGNNLFQVACAIGVSLDQGKKITLPFNKTAHSTVDNSEIIKFKRENLELNFQTFGEPGWAYSTKLDIPNVAGNLQLCGYFQNENYFIKHRKEVCEAFKMSQETRDYLISKYNPTGCAFIHVRRGDYVRNSFHEIPMEKYYTDGIRLMKQKYGDNVHFLVFSDDIAYCKTYNVFQNINKTFIEGENEVKSLYLMSLCTLGGICPNSSYSWWGAWLNESPDKMVIFPNKWLNCQWVCNIYPKGSIVLPV